MSYDMYNYDQSYNQAITKIYRARQRAAEMERLGAEMRKLQAQMNHNFPKSTERWYDTRSGGSLQISGGLSGKSEAELAKLASHLGRQVGTTKFWISTPEVRFRVRDLLRKKRYKEVISTFQLILEERDDEVLDWFGLERETFEVRGWGMSEPVRTHTQIVSDEEQKRRAAEEFRKFLTAVQPRLEADIQVRFNKLVDEGHRIARHHHFATAFHELLKGNQLSDAESLLDQAESANVERVVKYISNFLNLSPEERTLFEVEIKSELSSPAQLDAEFQADRQKGEEVDPLDQVLTLKKKVEGCTQAEEETRSRARKAKIMCSALAVGYSVGGILFSSVLLSIIFTVLGLIFLAGALNPIKNNALVKTAIENRKQAQGQLDEATTEWLKAEGLS